MCLNVHFFSSDVKNKNNIKVDNSRLRQQEDLKMKSQNAISIDTKIVENLTGSQEARMNLSISETISASSTEGVVWSRDTQFLFVLSSCL